MRATLSFSLLLSFALPLGAQASDRAEALRGLQSVHAVSRVGVGCVASGLDEISWQLALEVGLRRIGLIVADSAAVVVHADVDCTPIVSTRGDTAVVARTTTLRAREWARPTRAPSMAPLVVTSWELAIVGAFALPGSTREDARGNLADLIEAFENDWRKANTPAATRRP